MLYQKEEWDSNRFRIFLNNYLVPGPRLTKEDGTLLGESLQSFKAHKYPLVIIFGD
jgi:hypothetical protein